MFAHRVWLKLYVVSFLFLFSLYFLPLLHACTFKPNPLVDVVLMNVRGHLLHLLWLSPHTDLDLSTHQRPLQFPVTPGNCCGS